MNVAKPFLKEKEEVELRQLGYERSCRTVELLRVFAEAFNDHMSSRAESVLALLESQPDVRTKLQRVHPFGLYQRVFLPSTWFEGVDLDTRANFRCVIESRINGRLQRNCGHHPEIPVSGMPKTYGSLLFRMYVSAVTNGGFLPWDMQEFSNDCVFSDGQLWMAGPEHVFHDGICPIGTFGRNLSLRKSLELFSKDLAVLRVPFVRAVVEACGFTLAQ
eukprot:ANDGO_05946.mRNA.1 hypothetical protein